MALKWFLSYTERSMPVGVINEAEGEAREVQGPQVLRSGIQEGATLQKGVNQYSESSLMPRTSMAKCRFPSAGVGCKDGLCPTKVPSWDVLGNVAKMGEWHSVSKCHASLTSRWERVKMTGSIRKTRLDSLLMEAAMTCELTTSEGLRELTSPPNLIVAFSVERKKPKLL